MNRRLLLSKGRILFFGKAMGFAVNYDERRCAIFDVLGRFDEIRPEAYTLGNIELRLRNKITQRLF